MRRSTIRVALVTATLAACGWLAVGTASAVTPSQCTDGHGVIRYVFDEDAPHNGLCFCQGGFYGGLEVFGSFVAEYRGEPWPMMCGGLK